MRTHKHYTNATFTHRVDHDGGRHRPPRAPSEPSLCAGCGAVYINRHWSRSAASRVRAARRAGDPIAVRVCPACRQRTTGVPHGFLHVSGEFVAQHREDILHLLHNEVSRAMDDNPLGQVLDWGEDGTGGLLLTTTTEHLAIRLGRGLEKAFDGKVLYGFSHENKLAHVWWHRDAACA
jgi:NMD protein affecting ribosome stability and mRNA decay